MITKENSREVFLKALRLENKGRPPIWVMRQAGRYLPEYRKLKEQYSFVEMVKTPELALEVTMQPLRRFDLDAAILFSDILVIPEALGQAYSFREGGGIEMEYALDGTNFNSLMEPEVVQDRLRYVPEALSLIKKELAGERALLGFGGSPWTLSAYMVEGGSSEGFGRICEMARENHEVFHSIMERLSEALILYFRMQIEAGADAIQIFDSWGGLCPSAEYWRWSLQYIQRIIQGLPEGFPIILYAKGKCADSAELLKTGAKFLAVDHGIDISKVREAVGEEFGLQGNMDPEYMSQLDPDGIEAEAQKILNAMQGHPGYIFNLGHGIRPDAKIENMEALVKTVRNYG